jgi:hypothetical protein
LCYSATHQSCYGLELLERIPENEWYCMRCSHLLKHKASSNSVRCFLCPKDNLKGLMRKIKDGRWAHYQCINWTPEIFFDDPKKDKIILDSLDLSRFNKICSICKKSEGSCLNCDFKYCPNYFHVRCADKMNLIKSWDLMPLLKDKE